MFSAEGKVLKLLYYEFFLNMSEDNIWTSCTEN